MIDPSPTVGEQLRTARETRGISLQEAAKATHIKLPYLQELESDHPELLHSAVQARGFLRLYASYLGLEPRALVGQWEIQFSPASPEMLEITKKSENDESRLDIAAESLNDVLDEEEPRDQAESEDTPEKNFRQRIKAGISGLGASVSSLFPKKKPGTEKQQDEPANMEETPQAADIHLAPQLSSQEIFTDIGRTMRDHRERLELSLTDVEHFTNLKRIYLNAIESGKFNELPSSVQGRGMLNNYARFLGMDDNAVLDRFAEGLQRQREERTPVKRRIEPAVSVRVNTPPWLRRVLNPDLIVGGVLILSLFGFIAWGASRVLRGSEGMPTDAPSISEVLGVTPSATLPFDLTATALAAVGEVEDTPVPGVAVAQATPTVLATVNAAPLQLYIIAHDRAYMQIEVDGLEVFDGRVLPEEVYTFSGEVRIRLKTGNAAALEVYFNQDFLGDLGGVGEVVEIDFSLEGLVTPTPQPTRTPTPDLRQPEPEEGDAMEREEG